MSRRGGWQRCTCRTDPEHCPAHSPRDDDPSPETVWRMAAEFRKQKLAAKLTESYVHPGQRRGELREFAFRKLLHPDGRSR